MPVASARPDQNPRAVASQPGPEDPWPTGARWRVLHTTLPRYGARILKRRQTRHAVSMRCGVGFLVFISRKQLTRHCSLSVAFFFCFRWEINPPPTTPSEIHRVSNACRPAYKRGPAMTGSSLVCGLIQRGEATPWRECRFLLTPAAKINSAAPFCAIETNQVSRL